MPSHLDSLKKKFLGRGVWSIDSFRIQWGQNSHINIRMKKIHFMDFFQICGSYLFSKHDLPCLEHLKLILVLCKIVQLICWLFATKYCAPIFIPVSPFPKHRSVDIQYGVDYRCYILSESLGVKYGIRLHFILFSLSLDYTSTKFELETSFSN